MTLHPRFEELARRARLGPVILGVLNVTPDSFSDGGLWLDPSAAVEHALAMAADGADVVDLGGESTRPGAPPVPLDEEWARVGPVLAALQKRAPQLAVSVDTTKAEVARRAAARGACMVNDVSALRGDPDMGRTVAEAGLGLCLMHRMDDPASARWSAQEGERYGPEGVTAAVLAFFRGRLEACSRAGIGPEAVWLDPGLGFGKSVADNLRLIKELGALAALGRPVVAGPSRKSFLGAVLGGVPIEERLAASLAACSVALWQGASVLRVHDVAEAARAARLVAAVRAA